MPEITVTVGTYAGILLGIRTYEFIDEEGIKTPIHVLYIPFVDFALTIRKRKK